MAAAEKAPGAFKTIGELSAELGVAQHILRYWESKFPQLRPLQRAGNRRYYRPDDVQLARRIHRLLNEEGYTVRGVQKMLRAKDGPPQPEPQPQRIEKASSQPEAASAVDLDRLIAIRDRLATAIGE